MKKTILMTIAAAALFYGCSQTTEVEKNPQNAISFDTPFVNNLTRGGESQDFSRDNLPVSAVYGDMKLPDGDYIPAFRNVTVNKEGKYTPVQYWQKNAQYWFEAFAPEGNEAWKFTPAGNGLLNDTRGTLAFDNETADGRIDLLACVPPTIENVKPSTQSGVPLHFQHQLSRVRVKFTNKDYSPAYNLVFKEVSINALSKAEMDVREGLEESAWKPGTGMNRFSCRLDSNTDELKTNSNSMTIPKSATTGHVYLIPDNGTFTVQFTVTVYQIIDGGEISVKSYEQVVDNVQISDMKKGYSYTLCADMTKENVVIPGGGTDDKNIDITFTVEVEEWKDWDNTTLPDFAPSGD